MTDLGGSDHASEKKQGDHDTLIRVAVEGDVAAFCGLFGVAVGARPEILPSNFATTRSADLLVRVGPRELVHIEYQLNVASDMVRRMLLYRALVMERHPRDHLTQLVLVLKNGRVKGHDDLAGQNFALNLEVLYLREQEPSAFLEDANLAPYATLARGTRAERLETYARAAQKIADHGGERGVELINAAVDLATIRIDRPTIREINMGVHVNDHDQLMMETLRDTPFVAPLQREAREQGRTEGRSEGRSGFLDELLRSRFGDHPAVAEVAQRLSAWPAAQALAAVENADTIEAVPATPEINLRDGAPA